MHDFGVWYYESGWALMALAGVVVGVHAGRQAARIPISLVAYVAAVLIVASIAFAGKHFKGG